MSKKYCNKGNRYNKSYYNDNINSYGNYNNYDNNYNHGGYNNNFYNHNYNNNKKYNNDIKKNNYDRYNYNGINTKYKEKKNNHRNDDYFEKKFKNEIKNDFFDQDTKLIISSCLKDKEKNENKVNNNDDEILLYENNSPNEVKSISNDEIKENEEKDLLDEFYNKYMGIYEKQIEIDDIEKYCKEVNEKEVRKGELVFKEEFQNNKMNNGIFNPKNYEIFKVVHGVNKKGQSTHIIDFSFNKKGVEENNLI